MEGAFCDQTHAQGGLHCHIEGATPPALALSQAKRYGIDTSAFIRDGEYAWQDFTSFVAELRRDRQPLP
jgi:adenosine deaminase